MKVSLVFPTRNEKLTIGGCINKAREALRQNSFDVEVIVCDSSVDATPQIALDLGADVISCTTLGYGRACRTGLHHSSGNVIVICDADGTYPLEILEEFIEPAISGEADLVIGNRFTSIMEKGAMPWHHKYVGNPFLTGVLNLLFGMDIKDAHCGMRAVTRKAYQNMHMKCDGMEFASEMLVEAKRCGLTIRQVPIPYFSRRSPSHLNSFSDGWRHFWFLVSRWIRSHL
ncbi:MAG: glycosyltransferase family 2 protein [Theionarchaea archaeon]|nr:glycosyltransferase family 2 protein [Theionarchaea archaeon]MBU7038446.1 glycosyltransferase family 2 protein [Theionarchaea archaeon]